MADSRFGYQVREIGKPSGNSWSATQDTTCAEWAESPEGGSPAGSEQLQKTARFITTIIEGRAGTHESPQTIVRSFCATARISAPQLRAFSVESPRRTSMIRFGLGVCWRLFKNLTDLIIHRAGY